MECFSCKTEIISGAGAIREVENMGFALKDYDSRKTPYKGGINWGDLDVKGIQLDADGLRFKGGVMYGVANSLSFTEKSGFTAYDMRGDVKVGNGKTIIEEYGKKAVPQWMERVADSFEGKIVAMPTRADIDFEVSEQLIVELYSR